MEKVSNNFRAHFKSVDVEFMAQVWVGIADLQEFL